jgi:hypothetical protein
VKLLGSGWHTGTNWGFVLLAGLFKHHKEEIANVREETDSRTRAIVRHVLRQNREYPPSFSKKRAHNAVMR